MCCGIHPHARLGRSGEVNAKLGGVGYTTASCIALTDKTCDHVAELSEVLKAYLALERFVSPEYEDEGRANLPHSRAGLGALFRVINTEIQRLMGALVDTTVELQRQMVVGR